MTILANLTSWWAFDGDLTDSHGSNPFISDLTVAGYEAGKSGQRLQKDSRATLYLAAPIAISTGGGQITEGGWFYYDGVATGTYIGGLARHKAASTQEVMTWINASGAFRVMGWKDAGINTYGITDPNQRSLLYPVTVQVHDSIGQSATSDQVIRIFGANDHPAGNYFVVSTWNNGTLKLYVNAELVGTLVVSAVYNTPIYYMQVGAVGYGLSACGWEDAFLMDAHCATQAEIDWLYNAGTGRTYADVEAE